jgi:oxygen-independent coproporphyrinogen-3 oxidase
MTWDQDALSLLQAAPPSIQPVIRRQIEASAATAGVMRISSNYLVALMKTRHGASAPACVPASRVDQAQLEQCFARETGDPLTTAFEASDEVHVFAGGRSLPSGEAAHAWIRAEQGEQASRRSRCLYVHVPFCRSRCVFCPFYANRWTPNAGEHYVNALVRELQQFADTPLGQERIDAVYFGGGTPSDLSADDLTRVLDEIRGTLFLAHNAEITLEGRISGVDGDLFAAAVDGGVNRVSLGVQTFDTRIRQSLGRKASRHQVIASLERLAAYPIAVVIDLIFGLPGQDMQAWLDDLRCLVDETGIHGVDLYRLKSVPGSLMEQSARAGRLPPPGNLSQSASMFANGVDFMQNAGWERLSVSHWRRDVRERSRYNTLIKSGADCVPIGCGAGGRVGGVRFFHTSDLSTYLNHLDEHRKPIASAIRLGEESLAIDVVTAQLDQTHLDPRTWPLHTQSLRLAVTRVLGQWTRAGLLLPVGDGTFDLTVAGQFWNVQMGVRLARLLQAATQA